MALRQKKIIRPQTWTDRRDSGRYQMVRRL